jgi:hypothetical protein
MITLVDVRVKIEYAILTIRPDEYNAVLAHFPSRTTVRGSACYDECCRVKQKSGYECGIAIMRMVEQGQGFAHEAARNAIDELDPCCLVLVGIAGGVSDSDFTTSQPAKLLGCSEHLVKRRSASARLHLSDHLNNGRTSYGPLIQSKFGKRPATRHDPTLACQHHFRPSHRLDGKSAGRNDPAR